jgi:hypothetical protein
MSSVSSPARSDVLSIDTSTIAPIKSGKEIGANLFQSSVTSLLSSPAASLTKHQVLNPAIVSISAFNSLALGPKEYGNVTNVSAGSFNVFSSSDYNNDLDLFSSYADSSVVSLSSPVAEGPFKLNQPTLSPVSPSSPIRTVRPLTPPLSSQQHLPSLQRSLSPLRSTTGNQTKSLTASISMHSILFPPEDSLLLPPSTLPGRISSSTSLRKKTSAQQSSFPSLTGENSLISSVHHKDSLENVPPTTTVNHNLSVIQIALENNEENGELEVLQSSPSASPATSPKSKIPRQPMFRPFRSKKLSANPVASMANKYASIQQYHYSVNKSVLSVPSTSGGSPRYSQRPSIMTPPPPITAIPVPTTVTAMMTSVAQQQPALPALTSLHSSTSLGNLSLTTDQYNHMNQSPSSKHMSVGLQSPERVLSQNDLMLLGGELEGLPSSLAAVVGVGGIMQPPPQRQESHLTTSNTSISNSSSGGGNGGITMANSEILPVGEFDLSPTGRGPAAGKLLSSSLTDLHHQYHQSTSGLPLYRPTSSSKFFRNQSLEPLPYQVHKRILGWKLTSVQRRKELVTVLDMMKTKGKQGGNGHGNHAGGIKAGGRGAAAEATINQQKYDNGSFTVNDFIQDMYPIAIEQEATQFIDSMNATNKSSKLTLREVGAWQGYVTRNIKSRQNYKSTSQIATIMEEKRKTLNLTEISTQRYELLRNRQAKQQQQQQQHQNQSLHCKDPLNEKSIDSEIFSYQNHQLLAQLNPSMESLQTPSVSRAGGARSRSLADDAAISREEKSKSLWGSPPQSRQRQQQQQNSGSLTGRKSRPSSSSTTKQLYNYPMNIHRVRDRMDILHSVELRHRLEDQINHLDEGKQPIDANRSRNGERSIFSRHRDGTIEENQTLLGSVLDDIGGFGNSRDDDPGDDSQLFNFEKSHNRSTGSDDFSYLKDLLMNRENENNGSDIQLEETEFNPEHLDSIMEKYESASINSKRESKQVEAQRELSEQGQVLEQEIVPNSYSSEQFNEEERAEIYSVDDSGGDDIQESQITDESYQIQTKDGFLVMTDDQSSVGSMTGL